MLTPARRRGHEVLDDPDVPAALRERSLRDVARANLLFGGRHAVLAELRPLLRAADAPRTLLDVGTGVGDIPAAALRLARDLRVPLAAIGLDGAESLARTSAAMLTHAVCGDALRLPLASRSVDVVTCSQVAHHFEGEALRQLLAELHRVARRAVIVADLRRSWLAVAGIWSASFPLGFHPVSRQDGMASVLRGFTPVELRALVHDATGVAPQVRTRPIARVTAVWTR